MFEPGGDNNLAVVLGATNNQNVICEAGTPPSRSACSDIIMHMFANPTRRRFGANLVAPDVRIPLIYKSCKFLTFPHSLCNINQTVAH